MNQEQKQAKLEEKVRSINTLLVALKISLFGKQKVSRDGTIENVVVYQDMEQYPEENKDIPTGPEEPINIEENV